MSSVRFLNILSRSNQPFAYPTEPCRRKFCCSLRYNSNKRHSKTACSTSARPHHAGTQRSKPKQDSQVADQPVRDRPEQRLAQRHGTTVLLLALSLAVPHTLFQGAPALAFTIHQEPENALSFPTWVIHISSVIEWAIAMSLVWKYAEVTGALTTTFVQNTCLPYLNTYQQICQQTPQATYPTHLLVLLCCCCSLLQSSCYIQHLRLSTYHEKTVCFGRAAATLSPKLLCLM